MSLGQAEMWRKRFPGSRNGMCENAEAWQGQCQEMQQFPFQQLCLRVAGWGRMWLGSQPTERCPALCSPLPHCTGVAVYSWRKGRKWWQVTPDASSWKARGFSFVLGSLACGEACRHLRQPFGEEPVVSSWGLRPTAMCVSRQRCGSFSPMRACQWPPPQPTPWLQLQERPRVGNTQLRWTLRTWVRSSMFLIGLSHYPLG